MRKVTLAFALSLLVFGGLLAWLVIDSRAPQSAKKAPVESLLLYCAANLKVPAEEVARDYRNSYGVGIQLQFGGSQTQLTNAQISRRGDLFLPADDSYTELARQKGMIVQSFPLATMHPVLAVKAGNPKNLHSLEDLFREGIQIAQANPDAAAIGKVTKPVLENAGVWDRLKEHTRVMHLTVIDVANAVKVGSVDAGIVWDTTIKQVGGLEAVELPVFSGVEAHISVSVLQSSRHREAAMNFAQYLSASDKGLKVLDHYGYRVAKGELWESTHK